MYVYNSVRRDGQLTLFYRLCELFACHVCDPLGVLSLPWVWFLTVSTLRLNSRDFVRGRSTTDNPVNAFGLSSIQFESSTGAHHWESKSGQPSVSVPVHHPATLTFGWNKSDHGIEPSFEVPKPVRYLHLLATPRSTLTCFICRMQLLKVNLKVKHRSRVCRVLAQLWRNPGQDTVNYLHRDNLWIPLVTIILSLAPLAPSVSIVHHHTQVLSNVR